MFRIQPGPVHGQRAYAEVCKYFGQSAHVVIVRMRERNVVNGAGISVISLYVLDNDLPGTGMAAVDHMDDVSVLARRPIPHANCVAVAISGLKEVDLVWHERPLASG
jgi:hypothetical protein